MVLRDRGLTSMTDRALHENQHNNSITGLHSSTKDSSILLTWAYLWRPSKHFIGHNKAPSPPEGPRAYRTTHKMTHPLGWTIFGADFFSKTWRWAHTTNMVPLERSRRDLSIDASLGACTLPVVEEISWEIRQRGLVSYLTR